MKKYMFDTNSIDKALHSEKANMIGERNDIEIYITATQAEEIANIPDENETDPNLKEKRIRLVITLLQLRVKLSKAAAVIGHARLGTCVFGNEEIDRVLNEIYNKMPGTRNINDCIVAEASIREGCTLVTEDKALYKAMKASNYSVLSWNEFLELIELV